jgi:site-specific recombinase XerD
LIHTYYQWHWQLIMNEAILENMTLMNAFEKAERELRARGVILRRVDGEGYQVSVGNDLRHRFAIRWLRNGGDIYHLSLHLGHMSIKTTEVYLGHLRAREQAAARGRAMAQSMALQSMQEANSGVASPGTGIE